MSVKTAAARPAYKLALGSAFMLFVALIVVQPSASAAAGSSTATTDFAATLSLNSAASAVAAGVTPTVQADPAYAGIQITSQGIEVDFAGTPSQNSLAAIADASNQSITALAAASAPSSVLSVPIVTRLVSHTQSQLQSVTADIAAQQPSLAAAGIQLSSWGPDIDSNKVLVHLKSYSASAASALQAAFGSVVTVSTDSQAASGSSRTADHTPWYGGDLLSGPSGCTSWFPAKLNSTGKPVVLTSGHCGAGTFTNNGTVVGTVTTRKFNSTNDSEVMPVASNLPYVWSDPTSNVRHVTGSSPTDTIGTLLCTDGVSDREVCNVRLSMVGQAVTYDGVTVEGLVYCYQRNLINAFSAGDSGGPVEATSGSTSTVAVGMIAARVISSPDSGWYMPTRFITASFGVTVIT